MAKSDSELHQDCMQGFIELANKMHNEGIPRRVVSAGLMTASGVYATYTAAGNTGGLNPSGLEKIAEAYKTQLEDIQKGRRERSAARAEQELTDQVDQMVSFPDSD